MQDVRLIAEIHDEALLFDLIHELGASFYRQLGDGNIEVLYYSGNKLVHFRGKISEGNMDKLKQLAWEISDIEIANGIVTIKQ